MTDALGFTLALALAAQSVSSPDTLPLTLHDKIYIIERAQARTWYKLLQWEHDPLLPLALGPEPVNGGTVIVLIRKSAVEEILPTLHGDELRHWQAAYEIALGTIPNQCTVEQERAGLCMRMERTYQ